MIKIASAVLFFLSIVNAYSQDTITIHYDSNWVKVTAINDAVYYRKAFADSNKIWTAYDYTMKNQVLMIGNYTSQKFDVKNGQFIYYYDDIHQNSDSEIVGNNLSVKSLPSNYKVNKKSEGKFLYGNKIGEWIYYNEYGMKVTVENFQNSKLSIVTNFYDNGVIKSKGKYVKGQREGEWLYWNAYGRLYLRGEFKKDRYVGLWYRYLKNGEIIKLLYSNGVLLNTNLGGAIKND